MKKYVFIIILSLVLSLCGCDTDSGTDSPFGAESNYVSSDDKSYIASSGNIGGDYIYRNVAVNGEQNVLLKYSIKNGEVTTVCQDPFCAHDDKCPFFITSGTQVVYIGNTVYYTSTDQYDRSVICRYEAESMKTEYVYSTENLISALFSYNYDLFIEENSADDGLTVNRKIIRLNTQTNGSFDIPIQGSSKIYEIKNERITWQRGKSYYTTDLDGNDITVQESLNERFGYVYRYEVVSEPPLSLNTLKFDVYRCEKNSDNEVLIASGIGPATFVNDKIIYFVTLPKDEQKVIYDYDGQKTYDYYGGNVYIMNLDGTNARLLCHADGCYISGMSPDRNNEWYCGDWIGINLRNGQLDSESGATYSADMLIVNTVTGEYVVCRYEE